MDRKRRIEHHGQVHTIEEWAEITGLSKWTIKSRLSNGWTVHQALDTPPIPRGQRRYCTPANKGCEGCYYWRLLNYSTGSAYHTRYCAYALLTGHRRPCPATHCTEYKPARRARKDGKNEGHISD